MRLHDKFTPRGIFAPWGKFAPRGKLMHINGALERLLNRRAIIKKLTFF